MVNLIEFGRMFLSYGLLMLIIVGVMAAAITIGIKLRKKKDAEAAEQVEMKDGE